MNEQAFAEKYLGDAIDVSLETGIPPQRILAQAYHESGGGQHAPGNNFFGVKARAGERGQSLVTTENVGGKDVRTPQNFAVYDTPADSFRAWANLMQKPRYKGLHGIQDDAQYADAMGRSGYATDPNYGAKLGKVLGKIGDFFVSPAQGDELDAYLAQMPAEKGNIPSADSQIPAADSQIPKTAADAGDELDQYLAATAPKPGEAPPTDKKLADVTLGDIGEGALSGAHGLTKGLTFGLTQYATPALKAAFDWRNGDDFGDRYAANRAEYEQYSKGAEGAHPVASTAGEVVGAVASPISKVLAPAKGAGVLDLAKAGAKAGGAYAAGTSRADNAVDFAKDVTLGALLSGGISGGLARAGQALGPYMSDAAKRLRALGVETTVGQSMKDTTLGRGIRKIEETLTSIPGVGADTARARAGQQFREVALQEGTPGGAKVAGENMDERIAAVSRLFNQEYGNILNGLPKQFVPAMADDAADIGINSVTGLSDQAENKVVSIIKNFFTRHDLNDITPRQLNDIQSKIRTRAAAFEKTSQANPEAGEMSKALLAAAEHVKGYIRSVLPKDKAAAFSELDDRFANFAPIRTAADRSRQAGGEFTLPDLFISNKRDNPLIDRLYDDARTVLQDRLGESGTATRSLAINSALGGGALASGAIPQAVASWLALRLGSTPTAQRILLGEYGPQVAEAVRKGLPLSAVLGQVPGRINE